MEIGELKHILFNCYCQNTCSPGLKNEWSIDNPSLGQCAISTLIVNDYFGGKIMRCMTSSGSHYYNLIDNEIVDLTVEQFLGKIPNYSLSEERTREYLLSNENTKRRYLVLKKSIEEEITFENKIRNNRYKMCVNQRKESDAIALLLEREEKKTHMGTDLEYINWLSEFTKNHPYFDDYSDSEYELTDTNSDDLNNIKDINLFFATIDKYVADNNGNILRDGNTIYYLIKYNENYFKIGYLHGQGGMFFAGRTDINEQAIDFNDIMSYYIINKPFTKKKTK